MIRFALPFILAGSFAYAAETAVSDQKFAPGPHIQKAVDEETNNIACVSDYAVTAYSRSPDVIKMTQNPAKVKKPSRHRRGSKSKATGYSMLAIRTNLNAHNMLEHTSPEDADSYYDDDSDLAQADHPAIPGMVPVPKMAKDSGPWLYNNGFVNLLDCPSTAGKMMDAKNIPKGAVVVYAGGHSGHIEIKTPSGWWSDVPRTDPGFAKGMKVIGVYVKPVYTKVPDTGA